MDNGTLGAAEAIARLERLRFAWRGDDLELDILNKLGASYMKAHNYAEGFNTIRQAAERTAAITQQTARVHRPATAASDAAFKVRPTPLNPKLPAIGR